MSKSKKRRTKNPSKGQVTVEVTIVPLQGAATNKQLSTAPDTRLGKILETASIATDRKDLMVDGKPATHDTVVKAGAKIQVRERPAGS